MSEDRKSFFAVGLRVLAVLLCSLTVSGSVSAAGVFAPDACDPQYYESMKSRAWLEAQREITQNQNLIFKPDSVLEYTCFDKFLGVLAQNAPNMFSGSSRWGAPPGDMTASLSNLVANPMNQYETANFNHTGLGGRMDAGDTYTLPAAVTPGGYTCANMRIVWMFAKCMDFIDEAAEDGFFTFAEYAADPDKRFLPTRCPGSAGYTGNLNKAVVDANTPWEEDPIVMRLNLIYPMTGPGCGGAQSKIKTGLVVEQSLGGVSKYNEYVCLVPGCHYDPTGMDTGTCKKN